VQCALLPVLLVLNLVTSVVYAVFAASGVGERVRASAPPASVDRAKRRE
jgi:hypothetical protein